MLSFALTYYFTDGAPVARDFKQFNLAVHLLNTVLVFMLARCLWFRYNETHRRGQVASEPSAGVKSTATDLVVPLAVAALWCLHPVQLTAVLYVVQRMTSLAATCTFAALLCFIHGRGQLQTHPVTAVVWMTLGPAAFSFAGLLFKENVVLVVLLLPILELAFFRRSNRQRRALGAYFAVVTLVPLVLLAAAFAYKWSAIVGAYEMRDFSMGERLMTQARVLWFYVSLLALPDPTSFGLYHDHLAVSRNWLNPYTTAPAAVAWIALVSYSLVRIRHSSLLAFAVLWFFAAHALESTFIGLELVFEHRNYLPSLGPCVALVFALGRLSVSSRASARLGRLALALAVLLSAGSTLSVASTWRSGYDWASAGVRNHPESSRFKSDLAIIVLGSKRDAERGLMLLRDAVELDPSNFAAAMEAYNVATRSAFQRSRVDPYEAEAGRVQVAGNGPDSDSLRAFADLLATDILERLRRGHRITSTTVTAIQKLQGCAAQGDPVCLESLDDYVGWVEAALDHGRTAPTYRAELLHQRARLLALQGDMRAAVDSIRAASALAPGQWYYRLYVIDFLIASDRYGEAESELGAMESMASAISPQYAYVEQRRQLLETMRDSGGKELGNDEALAN